LSCSVWEHTLQLFGFAAIDADFADIGPTANSKGLLCSLGDFMTQLESSEKALKTRTLNKTSSTMSLGGQVAGTRFNIKLYGEQRLSAGNQLDGKPPTAS